MIAAFCFPSAFDSSSDTGYVNLIPYRMRASSHSQATPSGHPPTNVWGWNYKYDGEFRSLPISSNSPRFIDQLRCLSLDSKLDRRLGYSQQPLYSSSSAPELSLGPLARSNSWQGERSRGKIREKDRASLGLTVFGYCGTLWRFSTHLIIAVFQANCVVIRLGSERGFS